MEAEKLQERQSFLAAVQSALDAYYGALVACTREFHETCCQQLQAQKDRDSVHLNNDALHFVTLDTLFMSLAANLRTAALINNQNPLQPEDVTTLSRMMDRVRLHVDLKSEEISSGFIAGLGGGAAAGAAIGSLVPGPGTAIGAILGGMYGGLGGDALAKNKRLQRRIGEVRVRVDSYLAAVKATEPAALAFIVEKCLKT
jgi:hypothetical protein